MPIFFQDLFKKAKELVSIEAATESRLELHLRSSSTGAQLDTRLDAVDAASKASTFRIGYADPRRGLGVWAERKVRGETQVQIHLTDPLLPVISNHADSHSAATLLDHDGLHLLLNAVSHNRTPTSASVELRYATTDPTTTTAAIAYDAVGQTIALSALKGVSVPSSPLQRRLGFHLVVDTKDSNILNLDLAFAQTCANKFIGLLVSDKFSAFNIVYNHTAHKNSVTETTYGADVTLGLSSPALRGAVIGWKTLYLESQSELKVNVNLDGVVKSRFTTRVGSNLSASIGSSLAASNLTNLSSHKIGFTLDFTN